MNIIVAVDKNMGIGCNGELLARIPEDMEFFKKTTLNKIVLMGHSTFRSLPHRGFNQVYRSVSGMGIHFLSDTYTCFIGGIRVFRL